MISMASSHCCVVARPFSFLIFFFGEETPLEAKREVSLSEMHGNGSSTY